MTENHNLPEGNQPPQYGSSPEGGQPRYQGGDTGYGQGDGPVQNQDGSLVAPKPVRTGALLVYISAAITIIGLIISPFVLMGSDEYKQLQDRGQSGFVWGGLIFGAVISVAIVVLQVLAARAATKGKNWGRITLLVLAILSLLSLLVSLGNGSGITGSVGTILLIIGAIMMWVGQGGRWFKDIKQSRNEMMR
ncbi:hypothetical protein [Rothia uropygialis]|uniref:hypothetical protein n=1 Tax=Kocuria sp. 36 TaxID=1415402 RepID=UPI00101B6E12|nr:hypothetical protein [Kocuria sp. 36]